MSNYSEEFINTLVNKNIEKWINKKVNISEIYNFDFKKYNYLPLLLINISYSNVELLKHTDRAVCDEVRRTRIEHILSFLNSIKNNFKEIIPIIICIGDCCRLHLNIPIFCYSKPNNTNSILLFNDYFISNVIYNNINEVIKNDIKFEHKKNIISFIGNPSNDDINKGIRITCCSKYINNKHTDFKITYDNNINKKLIENFISYHLSIKEQLNYKYLLTIDGYGTAWNRLPWQLSSNSLTFKLESNLIELYYFLLKDDVNYISVNLENIIEKKIIYDNNHKKSKKIIKESNKLIKLLNNNDTIRLYTIKILNLYKNIIK